MNKADRNSILLSSKYVGEVFFKPLKSPSYVDYHAEKLFTTAKKDETTGRYTKDGAEFKSVTGDVVPMFQAAPFVSDKTVGERAADAIWGTGDKTEKKRVQPWISVAEIDYDEFVKRVDQQAETGRARGTIFHKMVHYYLTNDATAREEAQLLMGQHNMLQSEFDWISEESVERIIKKTGTDFYRNGGIDKLHSEKTILSKVLGWGGTMDLLIDHSSNVYSIYDLKTGRHFSAQWENSLLKYGNTPGLTIFDSPRNRAKLQIMLYALMIKAENPNARFRNLELIHITNKDSLFRSDSQRGVDVPAFLHIIKSTLKNEHKELWQRLEGLDHFDKLFSPNEYVTTSSTQVNARHPNADSGMLLKLKLLELESLVMAANDIRRGVENKDEDSQARYTKIRELMKEIIDLKNDQKINYGSWDTDMAWMEKWLGSPTSSTNPYVKLYYSELSKAKNAHRKEYTEWRIKFDDILKRLQAAKGLKPVTSIIGGVDRQKLYGFAIKTEGSGESIRERFVTENDAEWDKLSAIEQEFLTFINGSISQFFVDEDSTYTDPETGRKVSLANRIVTYRTVAGREVGISNLQLYNDEYNKSAKNRKRTPFK